jgi:hypothetical protein
MQGKIAIAGAVRYRANGGTGPIIEQVNLSFGAGSLRLPFHVAGVRRHSGWATGSMNWNRAPPSGWFAAEIVPPWLAMIY